MHGSDCVLGVFGKLSTKEGGACALVAWLLDLQCRVFEYWMIFSLKNKLKIVTWKLRTNRNVLSMSLERSRWEDLMEFIWYDLDSECERYWFFKWFLSLKIQINCQKNHVLEGKISWGRGTNWADGTSHTSIIVVEAAKVSCQGYYDTVHNWCRSCQGTLVVHTITPCGHSLKMWDQMKACFLCFLSLSLSSKQYSFNFVCVVWGIFPREKNPKPLGQGGGEFAIVKCFCTRKVKENPLT